ncbi:MAG: hypothetical protein ACJAQT_000729 [Akkermansiaceae bacterium]|jgi:hypothetical protein
MGRQLFCDSGFIKFRFNSQPMKLISYFFSMLVGLFPVLSEGGITKTKLQSAETGGKTLFRELGPTSTGINFLNPIDEEHELKRLYISGFAGGGVSLGDLDNDGLLDVVLTSGARENKIYRQTERWKFEEVVWDSDSSKVWSSGAAVLDIDSDGDLDIYVCNYDTPNRLYINVTESGGAIRFEEKAKEWGLDISDASLNPSFADYDLDGDLDIFLLTSEFKRANGRPKELPIDGRNTAHPSLKTGFEKYYTLVKHGPGTYVYYNAGRENILLQSQVAQGEHKFVDVSKKAGIKGRTFGLSCTWYDHDGDGDPDLYVCNDFDNPDQLYLNNGNGTFTDVIKLAAPYTSWYAMGSDTADLNGDGRFDLVIADMGMTSHYKSKTTMGDMSIHKEFLDNAIPRQTMRNTCMINTGTGRFIEAGYMAGLANSDWTWAVKCADYDCDSLVDVFFANGMARKTNNSDRPMPLSFMFGNTEFDFFNSSDTREEDNLVFRNRGDLKFDDVSEEWGLKAPTMSYSAAIGDLDNDGDPDLVVAHLNLPVGIYENTTNAEKQRISVKLKGTRSNPQGIGAVVRVTAGGKTQVKAVNPMTGFISCNDAALQFGLGAEMKIEKLEVEWPSGGIDRFGPLESGFQYVVTESRAATEVRKNQRRRPDFMKVKLLGQSMHRDLSFDDYEKQPLLPWRQSQMGPGIAWADIDGDGDDDCFQAQGEGTPGSLSLQLPEKRYDWISSKTFSNDAASEDMAPLFFDADGDGRLDLVVTSGSVEKEPGNAAYADRLYLGEGEAGNFSSAYLFPGDPMSSSVAAAADFDRDGDLDLFIGGRVVPGKWPTSPGSRLYLNESKPGEPKFVLASAEQAGGLAECQRATSALWSDIDGDGWIDLIVTHEYGPIRVFANVSGQLKDVSDEIDFSKRTGIWNGIAGRDLDGDGDIDYVATNFGLNTTYKASMKKPELLYYGDLEGTGEFRVVEAKFGEGLILPRRGRSCSSNAMPSLKTKLGTYNEFAISSLEQIYTPKRLETSGHLELRELQSCAFINESKAGEIRFKVVPLPRMAQLAPGFGVVMTDLNGDSRTDVVLAQNFYSPQREVGRMSGSVGATILSWKEEGGFEVIEPYQSGVMIHGDTKGVTVNEFNGDGIPDLAFSVNSGPVTTFLNTSKGDFVSVRLKGRKGNLRAVGSKIKLTDDLGRTQTTEVYAGGSYLSQSGSLHFFGVSRPGKRGVLTLEITWPDGKVLKIPNVKPGRVEASWQ